MGQPNPATVEIPLTNGGVTIVDADILPLIEGLTWRAAAGDGRAWRYAVARPYAKGTRHTISLHRLVAGAKAGDTVDHINGNTLDNRSCNLRICTTKQNLQNRRSVRRETGQYKGSYRNHKGPGWRSVIMVDKKQLQLGYFATEVGAAAAYDQAAALHFGDFARLNFSPSRDWILIAEPPARKVPRLAGIHPPHEDGAA